MYRIYKITSHHVVDFAAEELKKYLRMMMPRCGEIEISYDPAATDGFRLGLLQDFSLDTSEAKDTDLDDILHIDTDTEGGIIGGSNPRSVLLAVYRYLTINGCRWLFPGIDGEWIPVKDIEAVKYHKMADCRYRGQCNEGAEYQPNMMEAIDFTPKIGMNIFMIEFDNPKAYYNYYYDHNKNASREAESVTAETVLQWKRQCEAEMSKRGLQFHDMGHGWTAMAFDADTTNGWVKTDEYDFPAECTDYVAMINGERKLRDGVALNTNFCMSNPAARKKVALKIADYAQLATNVDYLHVWLADGSNNHCECEECRKKTPSDYYIDLMNDIDEELTARALKTRIVFICYVDTTWAPEKTKLRNPDRFSLLVAAITRDYTQSVSPTLDDTGITLSPYVRNDLEFPKTVNEYLLHAKRWMKQCPVPALVYEYHFWLPQFRELGTLKAARMIYDDIRGYYANGYQGLIEDGSQRSFFPSGFAFYVYAETLFDTSVDFEALKEDYFSHAYGEDWRTVADFYERVGELIPHPYMHGKMSVDPARGKFYNPAVADAARKLPALVEEFSPFAEAHKIMPRRAETVSYKLLRYYLKYLTELSELLVIKAEGHHKASTEAWQKFSAWCGSWEIEVERWFDQHMFSNAVGSIFGETVINDPVEVL
ncbi:MAG: DUF4838 domain-containing protein [Ruminococcaceae bacterium]|nr:DUF4838 domain-containing protein [Oscillospiraceae bacterium]